MPVERGTIFTPDKKRYLIDEIQKELSNLDGKISSVSKNSSIYVRLIDIKEKLQKSLSVLVDKKGVITPQETDNILDLLGTSKKSRLESEFYMGIKKSTLYFIGFIAIGLGIFYYNKKRE